MNESGAPSQGVAAPVGELRASKGLGRFIQSPRTMRWTVAGIGAVAVALCLMLLFMLTLATDEQRLFERHYETLLIVNVAVAALLLAVILWGMARLWLRLRQGKFGSRLLIKLAMVFGLVGFAPGVVIYLVSYQFVSRSIESWFNVKVEGALDAGLTLGRATLDALSDDLSAKARSMASQLEDKTEAGSALALERLRDQAGVDEVILWRDSGQPIASAGGARYSLTIDSPKPQQLRALRSKQLVSWIEGLDDMVPGDMSSGRGSAAAPTRIKVQTLVHTNYGASKETRILQLSQGISPTLASNLMAVQDAYREYQERALARSGLRRMYLGTLTLALFLAVFAAMLMAAVLGNQITRPLLVLAEGVNEVAGGNLAAKRTLAGNDELAGLTRSFAGMTQQLADAQTTIQRSLNDVQAARSSLQTLLDNLTSGVVVLDTQGTILTANPGATRVLRAPLAAHVSRPLREVPGLESFARDVQQQFASFDRDRAQHGLDHWQASFSLSDKPDANITHADVRTLVARGADLPDHSRLVVLDDISDIVSAQRAQAWGEVARRLAHEIKNPLTPIQLSAERLQVKLDGKLEGTDRALLDRSVKTIVDQVSAMKRLVNDFRDFARLPKAELHPLDLNALVDEVLYLYGGAEVGTVGIHKQLDATCPTIWGDAQQLRQVIHNLVQNAQDASTAHPRMGVSPQVTVQTRHAPDKQRVQLVVQDNGPGFSEAILKRAFEPYVTTKSKGTGLGLAVVKKIADDHGARISVGNWQDGNSVGGAKVSLSFNSVMEADEPTAVATARASQFSTF